MQVHEKILQNNKIPGFHFLSCESLLRAEGSLSFSQVNQTFVYRFCSKQSQLSMTLRTCLWFGCVQEVKQILTVESAPCVFCA